MNSALKNRNLQLYFGGQLISQCGTWMQQMALSWMVYRLTNSLFMLGVIGFTSQAPSLIIAPIAGLIADRTNRHRLLIITQVLGMIQAGLLTALVFSGHAQLWQLVTLSAVLGVITSFDMPTRQSFLVDMLNDREQLSSAIAMNSTMNTLTRLIGPFLAGLIVTCAGEGICFLLNTVSYIAVIVALLFVKVKLRKTTPSKEGAFAQLKEGFNYAVGNQSIRDLIVLIALVGLFVIPFTVLMPAFARDVFHGDAAMLGFLTAASGAGSVIGALALTLRKGSRELSKWINIGGALSGLALIVFGLSTNLPISLLAVATIGFGSMTVISSSNTLIQTIVDEDKRGRVMSFVVMAFLGPGPFGCMAAGALANVIGAGPTMLVTGLLTLAVAAFFYQRIMHIHVRVTAEQLLQGVEEAEDEIAAAKA